MNVHAENRNLRTFSWSGETPSARILVAYIRSVPDHPLKTRFVKLLLRRAYARGITVRSPDGTRLSIDIHDFIGQRILRDGAYEPLSLARAVAIMSKGGVFVDVGANFGLYTCTLGTIEGVHCIAIDACAEAFSQLEHNVALNPVVSAKLVNAALSSSHGVKGIELPRQNNLGMARITDGASSSYFVAASKLSEVLEVLGPDSVRLLKIDVEGYELEVFRGLDWSSRFRPAHILMEFTDQVRTMWQTRAECLEFLRDRGYMPYTVDGEMYRDDASVPEDNLWLRSIGGGVE